MLEFLTELFYKYNLKYSALNTARSALSSFLVLDGVHTVGTHPLISRFMKGVFVERPAVPRYTVIWNVRVVLNYLRKFSPLESLGLRDLSYKLVMLLALTTGQRLQTLHKLQLDKLTMKDGVAVFHVTELLKQSKPGKVGTQLILKAYEPEDSLCVYKCLKHYLHLTSSLRANEKQLLISFRKPHEKVSKDTIARWVKTVMKDAGVDTDIFKPHSTRAASTSAASRGNLPVDTVLAAGGWASEKNFQMYYNKPVQTSKDDFATSVLQF